MINHSPHFSVHNPREWFPNCFGPCPTVNSQHYLHNINHHYCQTFSWTPRKVWLCVPAVLHALTGHHLGHSPAKKQVYTYRPQYSQNQVYPQHKREIGGTRKSLSSCKSWIGINDSTVFRWAQWSSFSLCAERLMKNAFVSAEHSTKYWKASSRRSPPRQQYKCWVVYKTYEGYMFI